MYTQTQAKHMHREEKYAKHAPHLTTSRALKESVEKNDYNWKSKALAAPKDSVNKNERPTGGRSISSAEEHANLINQ